MSKKKAPKLPDFYLYKPTPKHPTSLDVQPKRREYSAEPQEIVFAADKGNTGPVLVHFPSPLWAEPNPLRIDPGQRETVEITPQAPGPYKCRLEILALTCPCCHTKLGEKLAITLRPGIGSCDCAADDPNAASSDGAVWAYEPYNDVDEGDPVIIIKPE